MKRARWRGATVAVVAAVAGVLAACGGDDGPDPAEPVVMDELPSTLVVEGLDAGDDEGWLVGRSGGTARLYAVRADGALRTAFRTDGEGTRVEAMGGGAVVTDLRCTDGPSPQSDECHGVDGVVTFVSGAGTIDGEFVVWTKEGRIDGADGIGLAAATDTAAWIGVDGEYVVVEPGRGVAGRMPRIENTVTCAVGGEVYAIGPGVEPVARRWDGRSWVAVPGTGGGPTTATTTPAVTVTVGAGPGPLGPAAAVDVRDGFLDCARDGADVVEVGERGRLIGHWSPEDGYAAADPAGGPPPERPLTVDEDGGAFSVDDAGRLLERSTDGHFRPTGIEVEGFGAPFTWHHLHAAASDDVVIACTGPTATGPFTCQVAARDDP